MKQFRFLSLIRFSKGFSLVELMVVVAIVAITSAIAAPNLRQFLVRSEVRSAVNDISSALRLARSEAIKQNRQVTVCPSADGANCNVRQPYSVGWIVKTGNTGAQAGDRILADYFPLNNVATASSNVNTSAVTFLPNGLPASGFFGLTITVGNAGESASRNLVIARTGRTRVDEVPPVTP